MSGSPQCSTVSAGPCPHCGCASIGTERDASIFAGQTYEGENGNEGWKVRCDNCGSQTCWWHTKQQAFDAWNARPGIVAQGAGDCGELTHTRSCASLGGFESDCTCSLKWRVALATEQTMHRAWRKRAEEAEVEIEKLKTDRDRTARNRDMWKGQCERQAEQSFDILSGKVQP